MRRLLVIIGVLMMAYISGGLYLHSGMRIVTYVYQRGEIDSGQDSALFCPDHSQCRMPGFINNDTEVFCYRTIIKMWMPWSWVRTKYYGKYIYRDAGVYKEVTSTEAKVLLDGFDRSSGTPYALELRDFGDMINNK